MAVLRLGSAGKLVEALQTFLGIKADGDFGPKTEEAVKTFQNSSKLPATGQIDTNTLTELMKP